MVDYFFAFLVAAHKFSLNRSDINQAIFIEEILHEYLEIHKQVDEVAIVWLSRA